LGVGEGRRGSWGEEWEEWEERGWGGEKEEEGRTGARNEAELKVNRMERSLKKVIDQDEVSGKKAHHTTYFNCGATASICACVEAICAARVEILDLSEVCKPFRLALYYRDIRDFLGGDVRFSWPRGRGVVRGALRFGAWGCGAELGGGGCALWLRGGGGRVVVRTLWRVVVFFDGGGGGW